MASRVSLADLIRPGMTVALGDGFGAPRAVSAELSRAAARAGGVRLILGWVPRADPGLDFAAFADVRSVMPGWGLRDGVAAGLVRFPPVRLSAVPALLHGPWRPDLLVASLVPAAGPAGGGVSGGGYLFGSEVSWQRAAIDAGATVAAVVSRAVPHADAGVPLDPDQVIVVGESAAPPGVLRDTPPRPEQEEIARRVAALIPGGARLQVGPSPVGDALLRQLTVPARIDSGLLPESVVDLAGRGLLLGDPVATYLAGGPKLYEWANGRPVLHPVEYTHDLGRLSEGPFIAVNTAIEIDVDGQVNVEGTATAVLGGIGGHPDYAAAATRSVGGLSVIAVTSRHNGKPTLVPELSRPVSTPSHDVDVVVTEDGSADLRGLSRPERREALRKLWGV
ncbi:MAG TPA: acetyl-CoA hydrolase/transferase C-terminal domain-containing protein [Trebonia sp.]